MKILGIDYGEKRIGLAYGDELGVATPLPAAVQVSEEERLASIATLVKKRKITDVVVGYPYNMDGTIGFKAREVDTFIGKLEKLFALPVHKIDERLTSSQVMKDMGMSGKREREVRKSGIIDSGAATLILQDWLDMHYPSIEGWRSFESMD